VSNEDNLQPTAGHASVVEDESNGTTDDSDAGIRMDLPKLEESGVEMMKAVMAVRTRLTRAQAAMTALDDRDSAIAGIRADWDDNTYPAAVKCLEVLHATGDLLRQATASYGTIENQLAAKFGPSSIPEDMRRDQP